ncbi:hypothetical protein [Amycolatopsis sp. NPDC006125]|uniref:hypothetical protein n=1 Tax=Amycolatopsis sp. NPDC006125 TaxID=3156730 RepID=UPI0033BAC799
MRLHRGRRRSTLVHWPEKVDHRLDLLLHLANQAGENTSRAQLLAALVAATPLDGARLARLLRKYRTRDEDAFTQEEEEAPPLPQGRRKPGPRGSSLEPQTARQG